jgi:hypothetical protein
MKLNIFEVLPFSPTISVQSSHDSRVGHSVPLHVPSVVVVICGLLGGCWEIEVERLRR